MIERTAPIVDVRRFFIPGLDVTVRAAPAAAVRGSLRTRRSQSRSVNRAPFATFVEVVMETVAVCEATHVARLRAVLWSMRKVIAAARVEGVGAQALLFELHALADAGVALAESTETRDST